MTATVSRSRTRRLTGGGLATLAGVIALAAPHGALAASSSTSFADASGDAPAAIDITAATFSSDATAIVFTQRLRDAGAAAPLLAFTPEYGFAFKTPRDSFGEQRVGSATTVFGNANERAWTSSPMALTPPRILARGPSIAPRAPCPCALTAPPSTPITPMAH